MPQCKFCSYEKRLELEKKILQREVSQREAASIIGCSPGAVSRHMRNHISEKVLKAVEELKETHTQELQKIKVDQNIQEIKEGLDIISQLVEINTATHEILREAREENNLTAALRAIERVEKQLELQAKLLGKIQEGTTINNYAGDIQEFKAKIVKLIMDAGVRNELIEKLKELMRDGSSD